MGSPTGAPWGADRNSPPECRRQGRGAPRGSSANRSPSPAAGSIESCHASTRGPRGTPRAWPAGRGRRQAVGRANGTKPSLALASAPGPLAGENPVHVPRILRIPPAGSPPGPRAAGGRSPHRAFRPHGGDRVGARRPRGGPAPADGRSRPPEARSRCRLSPRPGAEEPRGGGPTVAAAGVQPDGHRAPHQSRAGPPPARGGRGSRCRARPPLEPGVRPGAGTPG